MAPILPISDKGGQQLNYYEILQLTPSSLDSQQDPSQALKRAYRRALLIHHPDKKSPPSTSHPSTKPPAASSITVDQISLAYATLSSPSSRSAYDKALLTQSHASLANPTTSDSFQTGIHEVDLDDLDYDAVGEEWFRSCRCGNERGYRFRETDLEEAADFGEVMVGCQDCSLWLRVRFAVVEEDDDDDDDEDEDRGQGQRAGRSK
jgi:curved DNA-binding protein CbpA